MRQGRGPACKQPREGCYQPRLLAFGLVGDMLSKVINWTEKLIVAHCDGCCERNAQDIMIENNAWQPFLRRLTLGVKRSRLPQRRGENIPRRGNSMCKGLGVCPPWGVKECGIFKGQRNGCSLPQLELWVRERVARTRRTGKGVGAHQLIQGLLRPGKELGFSLRWNVKSLKRV